MRLTTFFLASAFFLSACMHKATNPEDPFEGVNRKIHGFNMAFDGALLKPTAKVYRSVLPPPIRATINNFYNNIGMIPVVANDFLQADLKAVSKDAGRFLINSVIGIAGLLDPATELHYPLHKNDLGLTFAKWGFKSSSYIVIPFIGPSTVRDGISLALEYFLTPYPYISNDTVVNTLLAVRYVDLRAQLLESEKILDEALDQYSLLRDAYLQNRHYLIFGEGPLMEAGAAVDPLYVDEDDVPAPASPNTPP